MHGPFTGWPSLVPSSPRLLRLRRVPWRPSTELAAANDALDTVKRDEALRRQKKDKPVRVYIDGCFDMMHFGHRCALAQPHSTTHTPRAPFVPCAATPRWGLHGGALAVSARCGLR